MTFTISNFGDDEICYDFSNGGAATAHTLPANPSGHPDPFPNELMASYAQVVFAEDNTTLPPARLDTSS